MKSAPSAALCFLLCGAPLGAVDGPVRLDVAVGASVAGGDLKNRTSQVALAYGAGIQYPIARGQVIALRADWSRFPQHTTATAGPMGDSEADALTFRHSDLGLEYLFFPSRGSDGLHLDLGVSRQRWTIRDDFTAYGIGSSGIYGVTLQATASSTQAKTVPVAGFGYQWRSRFDLRVRYSQATLDQPVPATNPYQTTFSAPVKAQLLSLELHYSF